MNIKKFIAKDNQEAIRMVKKEMGPDAVILKARTIYPLKAKGGGAKKVEVTAAVDYNAPVITTTHSDCSCANPLDIGWRHLEKDIREIKEALFCMNERDMQMPDVYFNQGLKDRFMSFKQFGLQWDIIRGLMIEGYQGTSVDQKSTTSLLQESLSKVLAKILVDRNGGNHKRRKIYSFIGPTGVGKTTTLAKLAAVSALQRGKKVSLITLDTFRIAAVSQLQTYSRIMDIPLEIATSSADLRKAIQKHSNCDRIFIDTAGRSPNQDQDIHELKKLFAIPEEIHPYLILSATSGYKTLVHTDKRFGSLPVQSYIFTKLDEAKDSSSMVNFLISRQKPVSYFTAGQQVPEDIEIASKKKIASILLSGMRENMNYFLNKGYKNGSSDRT